MMSPNPLKLLWRYLVKRSYLCTCSSAPIKDGVWINKAMLTDGHWTEFLMGRCAKCGGWIGFPPYNFKLAVLRGTKGTKKWLKSEGCPVDSIAKELKDAKGLF